MESRKIAQGSPVYKINSVDNSNYMQCHIWEFMASHKWYVEYIKREKILEKWIWLALPLILTITFICEISWPRCNHEGNTDSARLCEFSNITGRISLPHMFILLKNSKFVNCYFFKSFTEKTPNSRISDLQSNKFVKSKNNLRSFITLYEHLIDL